MVYMEQKNNEKYDLYTEHIVPNTGERIIRGLKRGAMVAVVAVFFGLVAGLVMIIVYQKGTDIISEPTREQVKLPNDYYDNNNTNENVTVSTPDDTEEETTTQPDVVWDEEMESQLAELNNSSNIFNAIVAKVNEYTVTVIKQTDVVVSQNSYHNLNETFGMVMAEDSTYYYILTDAYFVKDKSSLKVKYAEGKTIDAEYVQSDVTTGLAIVRTLKEELSDVKIAVLGNSDSVRKGNFVIAVGDLYGFTNSMGYGFVTGAGFGISDTDTEFKMICTNIVGTEDSFGVIANSNGEVTGIITTNYNSGSSNHIMAYSIQGITDIIERLMNGHPTVYLGIKGQAVTQNMIANYGYPGGIYVTAVETGSPAYFAGIQPGDIIYMVNKVNVNSLDRLGDVIFAQKEGSTIDIVANRKGREKYKEIVFSATLGVE